MIVNDVSHMKAAERRIWFAAPLVLLALAILLGLGTWQVKRLYWKEALIADIEERRNASPATLAQIEAIAKSGGEIEYRRVNLSGTFDHARERHFSPPIRAEPVITSIRRCRLPMDVSSSSIAVSCLSK